MHYIVDIDGTIADAKHREHYLKNQDMESGARWTNFFNPTRVLQDAMIPQAEVLDKLLQSDEDRVTFLTGRPERLRGTTQDWLWQHFKNYSVTDHPIVMKTEQDKSRPAGEWKVEQLKRLGESNFTLLDDDDSVRGAIREAFPKSIAMEPVAGWEDISQQLSATSPETSEEVGVPPEPITEDYSDMDGVSLNEGE